MSSKFMALRSLKWRSGLGGVLGAQPVDQFVFPFIQAAEADGQEVGAAVEEVAVHGPGKAHAAMHLDIVLGAMLESLEGKILPGIAAILD